MCLCLTSNVHNLLPECPFSLHDLLLQANPITYCQVTQPLWRLTVVDSTYPYIVYNVLRTWLLCYMYVQTCVIVIYSLESGFLPLHMKVTFHVSLCTWEYGCRDFSVAPVDMK